jgi:Protein of unknown function (DUF2958)
MTRRRDKAARTPPEDAAGTPPGTPRERQRARRGHAFYPPAMSTDPGTGRPVQLPGLYATQEQSPAEKVLHAHYFVGGCDWWIAEYDTDTGLAFGYACLGDADLAEWGYVDLCELEAVAVHGGLVVVERDLSWRPVRAGEARLPGRRVPSAGRRR